MMRVEAICLYDANDPLCTMQVEDMGDCYRLHIVNQHGNRAIDIRKEDSRILESFLRNRREPINMKVH